MYVSTSELCDIYLDQVDVADPIFSDFGGVDSFAGQITTIRCFEDNGLIMKVLAENGEDRVLVIDGGGITRTALIDEKIAKLAVENNWQGIIVNGAIRNVTTLSNYDIGIKALASIPVGAFPDGIGEVDVPVNFAGVTFLPEDFVYADLTGIILSPDVLEY